MKLSKNFTLEEMLVSKTYPELIKGIHVPEAYKWNLVKLAKILLQNIRGYIDMPVFITSGFRTRELNMRVGGAENSQHRFGEAADWMVVGESGVNRDATEDCLKFIKDKLHFAVGECIEYRYPDNALRFVHISLPDPRYYSIFRTIRVDKNGRP